MYRTTKLIKVDVWQMGLLYYVGAAIILFLQVRAVVDAGTYLLHEPIIGSVNPFAVGSTYDSVKAAAKETEYDYCKGGSAPAAWATIDVDNDFVYAPTCETLHKYEVATKSTDFISFITSSMNFQTYGWPCGEEGGAHATDALSKCDAGTNTTGAPGEQCTCTITKSYYSTAVEDYSINFAHGYAVSDLQGRTWSGQSVIPAADINEPYASLDTRILMPDGSVTHVEGGGLLELKLADIITMAKDREGQTGMSLDDLNPDVGKGVNGELTPHLRTTGLTLNVVMEYSNRQPGLNLDFTHDVDVEVKVRVPNKLWTSTGPKTTYVVQPYGTSVGKYYHRVIDYPQNINVNFQDIGYAVALDINYLISVAVNIIVLVGVWKAIMDFVVFNLQPNGVSTVLKNKREEVTNRQRAFAELGLKAAISVGQFNRLDDNNNGRVKLADLTAVFGKLEHVDRSKAMQIAKTVMKSAKSYGGTGDVTEGLNFGQFMSIAEGSAITFDEFLKLVHKTGNIQTSMKEEEAAMVAYAEAAKGITLDEEEAPAPAPPASAGVAAAPAPPVVRQPPALPPGVVRAVCHACRRPFGVPAGARMVACPHCQTVNQLNQSV